jgi:hypothetical protein
MRFTNEIILKSKTLSKGWGKYVWDYTGSSFEAVDEILCCVCNDEWVASLHDHSYIIVVQRSQKMVLDVRPSNDTGSRRPHCPGKSLRHEFGTPGCVTEKFIDTSGPVPPDDAASDTFLSLNRTLMSGVVE